MASIRIETGPQPGKTIQLDKDKVTFGRNYSCDCVLKHPTVSREHFYIERNAGKYFVVDQGSNNGTYANEKRISWVELRDGDKIRAGPFTLTVELEGETAKGEANAFSAEDGRAMAASINHVPSGFDKRHAKLYPREYLLGMELFNSGRYFEAHEAWEEVWLRSEGEAKLFYQMLIQAAVGLHHYEKGNARGATGMYKNVCEKLQRLPPVFMSLDMPDFSRQFKSFFANLVEGGVETPHPSELPRPLIHLLGDHVND